MINIARWPFHNRPQQSPQDSTESFILPLLVFYKVVWFNNDPFFARAPAAYSFRFLGVVFSMRVALVIGTRPQIIKSAPIIKEAGRRGLGLDVVHTGQHYDYELSRVFFNELDLPDPVVNLGVGSGSHAYQTGKMLIELERVYRELEPDVVIVPGDTNSMLAGALAAAKMSIPVAHVEAGARSYDMGMPEEVSRGLTDHCSEMFFTV
jgi:UDP-N-acetylglucosamine 2-epimerase (non-hydrolysing)